MSKELSMTQEIEKLELLSNSNPCDDALALSLEEAKLKMQELNAIQSENEAVRSRAIYSIHGEKPSRMFCNMAKNQGTQKSIPSLIVSRQNKNIKIETQKEIEYATVEFYKDLYKSEEHTKTSSIEEFLEEHTETSPKLTNDEKCKLEGHLTLQEISAYLEKTRNNVTPGSTGFTGDFYKFYFNTIKHLLLGYINYSFDTNNMSVSNKLGIITLIPKGDKDKQYLKNWRPLTLLSTYYKLVSGCIAERLKPVLNKLIGPEQKAYLPGRFIGEVTRTTYDLFSYAKNNNLSGVILLVDFEKAFDSISFSFILETLNFYNFGHDLIKWVNLLLKDFKAVINHAGNISDRFNIMRGCRQGDPIAGYLFILGAEILTLKLKKSPTISGFKVNKKTHVLDNYADDLTIYLKHFMTKSENESNIKAVLKIISDFKHVSGLKANLSKTNAAWFGMEAGSNVVLCNDLGLKWVKQFKLLGIHFTTDLENMEDINFDTTIESIKKLLKCWHFQDLTPYGKITVIKSLALSKLTHISQILPSLQKRMINDLNNLFYSFLWNNKPDKVSRKTITIPEKLGGLGMIDINSFWSSIQCSWIRRLNTSESFWVHILHTNLYAINETPFTFFTWGESRILKAAQLLNNQFWKQTLKSLARLINSFAFCHPKELQLFSICNNPLFQIDNCVLKPKMFNNIPLQVADFLDNNTCNWLSLPNFNTVHSLIMDPFTHHKLKHAIKKGCNKLGIDIKTTLAQPSPRHSAISCILNRQTKGCKKYYNLLESKTILHFNTAPLEAKWHAELKAIVSVSAWTKYWSLCANIKYDNKIKWNQYQTLRHSLKTYSIVAHFDTNVTNQCPFCKNPNLSDTISHTYYTCIIVTKLWKELKNYIGDLWGDNQINKCNILFGIKDENANSTLNCTILSTKQYIWKCRFNKSKPNLKALKNHLCDYICNLKVVYSMKGQENLYNSLWDHVFNILSQDVQLQNGLQFDQQPCHPESPP